MVRYQYDVVMKAPIGNRTGKMTLMVDNQQQITGVLDILNHALPFKGTADEEGACFFEGIIETLVRKVRYIARGHFDAHRITLLLSTERSSYAMSGISPKPNNEQL